MIHFVVPAARDFSIREYLASWGQTMSGRMQVVPYADLPNLTSVPHGTWVFAAVDQLGPAMLAFAREMQRQLARAGAPTLNDPNRALVRYPLLRALHDHGINDFRAVRATDDLEGLRYPVMLRDERSHGGPIGPLLADADAVRREIGRALLRGRRRRDLILIEYSDTSDAQGYFRKYSAFAVGTAIIPRSVAYGHGWMLKHHGTEYSLAMVEEERDYVIGNPHEEQLARIFAIAGVGYGRIDYAVKDGALRVWEINLNPTIGRGTRPPSGRVPVEFEPIRNETKQCFYARFAAAWDVVDLDGADAMLPLKLDAGLRARAMGEGTSRLDTLGALRRALRPLRPLLDPIAARLFPGIGRLAQQRRWRRG